MWKKLFLVLLASGSMSQPLSSPYLEFNQKILEFEKEWHPFLVEYFGCKMSEPLDPDHCNPSLGRFDLKRFRKASEKAKKLFSFE